MTQMRRDLVAEWLARADGDLSNARILADHGGTLNAVAFHVQQAAEKYLKGFLIANDWTLRKIHDLELLITEASRLAPELVAYLDLCRRASQYYIDSRYPTAAVPIDRRVIDEDLSAVTRLGADVREALRQV